jgi:hypothetical protein
MRGREKRWSSGPALEEAVEGYFRSISRTVTAVDREDTGKKDGEGRKLILETPILNDDGEPIRYREYVVPPTVWGLCEYLGISRETWDEYCDPERSPRFRRAAARARGLMEDWSQRALLTRKDVRGLIYTLQNPAERPVRDREEELSLSQRREILEGLEEQED